MKTIPPAVAAVLACALAAGPCPARGQAAPPNLKLPEVRGDTIARLAVDGPHAFINRRPAPSGSYVFDGDTVTTGPGTSALLVLNDGGSVQLDQNTDPEFRLLRQGACLLMSILRGQAAIDTKGGCIEFRNQRLNTAGVARSVVNIRVTNREARVTVIEGSVEMMAPRMAKLGAYDQYFAASNGKSAIRRMTAADARAAGAWRQRYFRAEQPEADGPSDTDSSGAAAGASSGWCCFPAGAGAPSNPAACGRQHGIFHLGATNPNVCRPSYSQ
ncbi:FecR family protein [Massilia sp. R2A-15]|uniref:FecR family protein n=1 Tax=Massilia sp. R2A-15 TaxID=3064278 RepID=UPI0027338428|nr:FecR family protein [Massilia sp. R2A-15]WLI91227.1 FecR family protein [Massilia sp. R2A-15]